MSVLFKTANKKNLLKTSPQADEENPSTACRNPKKRRLIAMQGKTVVLLLVMIVSLVLVRITILPPPPSHVSQPAVIFTESFNKTYGGTGNDAAVDLVQTADEGFALVGSTNSYGVGGGLDMWLVKTDTIGNVIWNKTYGGPGRDWASSLVETIDGGFVLVGYTSSFGISSPYGEGIRDIWLVKTDANGVMIWNQTYGGIRKDKGNDLIQTVDGGFAILGYMMSYDAGSDLWSDDMWLVKTDANGVMIWNQTYGDIGDNQGKAIIQTVDGGFALVGSTSSFSAGGDDMWLVKTDPNGVMIWNRTYGYIGDNEGNDIIQTLDGGFALVGSTSSFSAGGDDMWLVKTDPNGVMIWDRAYGGAENDGADSLVQTTDGGFTLAGYTSSFSAGGDDMWLVKTDTKGHVIWNQTYGGSDLDCAVSLVQTSDGCIASVGTTSSFGVEGIWVDFAEEGKTCNMWLVKLETNGTIQLLSITTKITSSTPTPGWGNITILVAAVVLIIWKKRRKQ
jgi:hypothetical protein